MKLLLDTCTFLWVTLNGRELSAAAREAFTDPGNDVYLSVVSAWEIAVKHSIGRLELPTAPARFVPAQREAHGVEELPLNEESALHLARLPNVHPDPFDRMLVCQALVGGLTILTPDEAISAYPARVLW